MHQTSKPGKQISVALLAAISATQQSPFSRSSRNSFLNAARSLVTGEQEIMPETTKSFITRLSTEIVRASLAGKPLDLSKFTSEYDRQVAEGILRHIGTEGVYSLQDLSPDSQFRREVVAIAAEWADTTPKAIVEYMKDKLTKVAETAIETTFQTMEPVGSQ